MKKYIIALFIIVFSTIGINHVVNTSQKGPNGGWIWCVCTHNFVCHVNPSKNETIYGYAQER